MQGILSGPAIHAAIQRGDIEIDKFDPLRLNPASYDLALGNTVSIYTAVTVPDFFDAKTRLGLLGLRAETGLPAGYSVRSKSWSGAYLDAAKQNEVSTYQMKDGEPFCLQPGIGYLMHTAERIRTDCYVPIIDGKSSIGRLFASAHVTAGFGDPGFDGQYTLEVVVTHPLLVYPGMRFCQIRFHTIIGEVVNYRERGNYKGESAMGPVPSKSWKMFEK